LESETARRMTTPQRPPQIVQGRVIAPPPHSSQASL
jgi:hypothetical protein